MEKVKKLFLDLYADKKRFVLVLVYVGVMFLFFLGLLMPFILDPSLINGGRVSLAQFPGGPVYTLLYVAIMVFVGFLFVTGKDEKAKKMFFWSMIFAALIFLYGFVIEKVGLSSINPRNGIGKTLSFLMIAGMLFVVFGNKYLLQLIDKIIKPAKDEKLVIDAENPEGSAPSKE